MADFCRQCSIELFGQDFEDLANITKIEDQRRGYYCVALCEDCGFIQVDVNGNCISDCIKRHMLRKIDK